MVVRFLVCALLGLPLCGFGQDSLALIPQPVSVERSVGVYRSGPLVVTVPQPGPEVEAVLADFASDWLRLTGRRLAYTVSPGAAGDPPEGYHLTVEPQGIQITAASGVGVFYALQTLRQLMPRIPCVTIVDYPRYGFRGMHLDVSRHFFTVGFIKKYLDILAAYKLNTFHWHLTDSHGWRIEIKKYPRLTSVGAWRADRSGIPMTIAQPTGPNEPATYGGFYTQAEIRDIVAYAARRYITIIPEIEIPGHCTAAMVAYPEYTCFNNPVPLLRPTGSPGDVEHNLCLGYEPSFAFVEDILTEVMGLFPGSFIHIGGDEVRGGPWYRCPRCRERMREKGFYTAREYQDWFTHRIDSFINAHGKRMIGWDEVLEADISPGAAAMAWHNPEAALQALKKGHDMVMTPYRYTYFDFYQSDPRLEPNITYAMLGLDTVYAFEPTPPGLSSQEAKHVLGGEACLWTENFATPADVEYMLLPRLLALAEVLWTPAALKNYTRFVRKTEVHFGRFRTSGLHFATSLYNVAIHPEWVADVAAVADRRGAADKGGVDRSAVVDRGGIRVTLSDQTHLYPIRYTLDGSQPTMTSALYEGPLLIKRSAELRASVFRNGAPEGKINGDRFGVPEGKTKGDRFGMSLGKTNGDRFTIHLATGAQVRTSPDSAVAGPEAVRLVDGIHGTIEPYDGRWVIFHDSMVEIVIDLKKMQPIHGFDIGCMEDQVGDMYLPASISVAASVDGVRYQQLFYQENKKIPAELDRHTVHYHQGVLTDIRGRGNGTRKAGNGAREALTTAARFVKFTFRNAGLSPDPQKNLFVIDELTVR